MYFHYNSNQQIARAARTLSSKTNVLLSLMNTRVEESIKWFSTTALVDLSQLWRASVNKSLQEYLELGWVETVAIDNVPVVEQGEKVKFRKRNLWKLTDQEIGLELLYNASLQNDMLELGTIALNTTGIDEEASFLYPSSRIGDAVRELGSEPILNFLNAFHESDMYYRDAVEKLRGNGIACPKHDKLSKLCEVEFEKIGVDRIINKLLDREFTPDKSSGAPGYTYHLPQPGIRLNLRSTISQLETIRHFPVIEDWQTSGATASQISTLREGIVVG